MLSIKDLIIKIDIIIFILINTSHVVYGNYHREFKTRLLYYVHEGGGGEKDLYTQTEKKCKLMWCPCAYSAKHVNQ